ncbi:MAG: hypothetical protein AB9869_08025 [Verrucomicrobiia bacterium]
MVACLAVLVCGWSGGRASAADVQNHSQMLFYKPLTYGSDSQFNPITSFIDYGLDPLQIPKSFDDNHFSSRAETVWKDLTDPAKSIDESGGFRNFINRQVFPVGPDFGDSIEMIPNYGLHVVGGGMLYRKNVEWFQFHGYRYPRLLAGTLAMGSEFIHEVVERKTTEPDDPVADFYLMRPLGIALFSWDRAAEFASHTLRMPEWPYQPMISPRHGDFMNVGQNWILRPAWFGSEAHRPFFFYGLTTLLGTSHHVTTTDSISWGVGPAVRDADPDHFEYRWSGGLFYDRNGSLLASLMINGTENLAVRLNLYPGALAQSHWVPGMFFGLGDRSGVSVGFIWRVFPIGISDRFD